MDTLNYHHLRYFREVAHDGNLTRTAERLNVSQSALSMQIKTLEERLGHPLFNRVDRKLVLTEVGRIALDHADRIFSTGAELIATLAQSGRSATPLRIGALSTLSRNFQLRFLMPLLRDGGTDVALKSGSAEVLFESLSSLALDIVLTTEPPRGVYGRELTARRIDEQPVGLHGHPARLRHETLADLIRNEPLIVPSGSSIRSDFESLAEHLDVTPRIVAEVDDMAMVRLLARDDVGLALAPAVVLADEIAQGMLRTAPFDLQLVESFYAVVPRRSFPHTALAALLEQ
ncbi:LysR family transcriptional regulator [Sulfitobacter sp. JBTF-M27]|uniref:LysR family transcriptional regulator n=1 Tax=Sulfitobacter sediminilitoris TaxID=2698830 RepID=A0A6P0CCD8_9RHOB|nr:LysR family transcriptional regulator [Sulfitobacter sediminilitoris]NEK22816.1 LysR family transcriptional regulator [Sulfitobacter sediminilitoris]